MRNHERGLPRQIVNDLGEIVPVGCTGRRVNERVLAMALHDIITQLIIPHKEKICSALREDYDALTKPKDNRAQITAVEKKLSKRREDIVSLTDKYMSGIVPELAYTATSKAYQDEIKELELALAQLKQEGISAAMEASAYTDYIAQIERIVTLSDEDINEGLYERVTKKIVVHPEQVLEIHLSFMAKPIMLRYKTQGRGATYTAIFEIL